MTATEAIEAYSAKFGGYPYYEMSGYNEDEIVEMVKKALDTDTEIDFDYSDEVVY